MALPLLMLAGGAMAAGGLAGAYGSGAMGRGRRIEAPQINQNAYQWGGAPGAAEAERQRLLGYEEQGRGLALGARQGQQDAAGMYREMASGRGPSAGQAMLSAGMQRANQDATNLAASARGGGGSRQAAMRAAMSTQATNAAEAANRAALLRAQEQQAGIAGLAGVSGQMRGMDQQMVGADLDAGQRVAGQQLSAGLEGERNRMQAEMWAADKNMALDQAARDRKARLWGGLMGGGASMLGMGMGGG